MYYNSYDLGVAIKNYLKFKFFIVSISNDGTWSQYGLLTLYNILDLSQHWFR